MNDTKKNFSNKIPGCDLGTTNSAISIVFNGEAEVISNEMGKRTTPSIVFFSPEGQIIVGEAAKSRMMMFPDRVIYEIKRLIGRKFSDPKIQELKKKCSYEIVKGDNDEAWVKVANKVYSPVQISSFILAEMKKIAENNLGKDKVKKIVITVPAYFNDDQRQATKDAGSIAGLEVERIINEPTAAALSYGIDKRRQQGNIAVFDLGGGTFDISIINIDNGVFEVKATNGDTFLGGSDFDQVIIDWLIKKAKIEWNIDLSKDKLALHRLKEAAEKAKQELSFVESYDFNLAFITADATGAKHLTGKLLRKEFEDLSKDLINRLVEPCKQCLKDAKLTKVDEVILVGGMTRVPAVQNKVKEIFKLEPNKSINPDESVAIGASIQGSVLAGDNTDVLLLDVTPLSLGIEVEGGINHTIISKNTTIPVHKQQIFSTAVDNQDSVFIRVIEGESVKASSSANRIVGNFELSGIRKAQRGIPQIEVEFSIDSNGILSVAARDKDTGKEQKIVVSGRTKLSEEEINKMMEEYKAKEKEDLEFKENTELMNKAQSYSYTFGKQLEEFKKNNLDKDQKFQELEKLNNELNKAIEEKNYEELKNQVEKIDQLMKLSNDLMQQQEANKASNSSENTETEEKSEESEKDGDSTPEQI